MCYLKKYSKTQEAPWEIQRKQLWGTPGTTLLVTFLPCCAILLVKMTSSVGMNQTERSKKSRVPINIPSNFFLY